MIPELLHFRISHYNEKVRWALDYKNIPHRRTAYVPGFHALPVRLRTGQQQLPVMQFDGRTLVGSNHILAELERFKPTPPLFPEDPAQRSRALAIQTFFDEEVAPDLRRLFWETYLDHPAACARMSTDGANVFVRGLFLLAFPAMRPIFRRNMGMDKMRLANARHQLRLYLDRLESEIKPSGYLVGDSFGLADLAAAAVMTALIRPPQFPYPLPEPWPAGLVDLRASIAQHPAARWVLDIYARHRGSSSEVRA